MKLKFEIGEIVYLKTDNEQLERFVTGVNIRVGSISYALTNGTNESWHYDFEISKEIDVLKKITYNEN